MIVGSSIVILSFVTKLLGRIFPVLIAWKVQPPGSFWQLAVRGLSNAPYAILAKYSFESLRLYLKPRQFALRAIFESGDLG